MTTTFASEITWQSDLFASALRPAPAPRADASTRPISPRAAFQEALWGRATLVDIRPAAQRTREGAPAAAVAALPIDRDSLAWRLAPHSETRLPIATAELRVILLCQDGSESRPAAEALAQLGVRHATDVIGGFDAWRSLGLPVRA